MRRRLPGPAGRDARSALAEAEARAAEDADLARRLVARGAGALALPLLEDALSRSPDDAALLVLLGDARSATGDRAGAEEAYEAALDADPAAEGVELGLGRLMLADGRLDEAARALARAVHLRPALWPELARLADALLDAGRAADALLACQAMREVSPAAEAHALCAMGLCLRAMGRDRDAATAFRAASAEAPAMAEARENLVLALRAAGDAAGAAAEARAWADAAPDDPVAAWLGLAVAGMSAPPAAPPAAVRAHHDRIARAADVLPGTPGRTAANRVAAAVLRTLDPAPGSLDVLDVGCGAGLAGAALRPWARTLHGVDLSSAMLRRAAAREAYDRLDLGEGLAMAQAAPGAWDLVVADGPAAHAGDLGRWARAAADALRPGGALVLVFDAHSGPAPWLLKADGRYAHAPARVAEILEGCGLRTRSVEAARLPLPGGGAAEAAVAVAVKEAAAGDDRFAGPARAG